MTRCECFSFVQTWMSAVGMRLYVRMGPTASTLQGATSVTVSGLELVDTA